MTKYRDFLLLLNMINLNEILQRDHRTTLPLRRISTESLNCMDFLSCENNVEITDNCDKCNNKSQKMKHSKSLYLMFKSKSKLGVNWLGNPDALIALIDNVFSWNPMELITNYFTLQSGISIKKIFFFFNDLMGDCISFHHEIKWYSCSHGTKES